MENEKKFEQENLLSAKSLENSKTLNIFAVITDYCCIEKNKNYIYLTMKIIDKSIMEYNISKQCNTPKLECILQFKKSSENFIFPTIHKLGDIVMLKRATLIKGKSSDFNERVDKSDKFLIQLIMMSNLSFGYWVYDGCSKSDYLPICSQVNKEFSKYQLTDNDKCKIYELRKFIYEYYCLKNSLVFAPDYVKKINDLPYLDKVYFDLCALVIEKKCIENNIIILNLNDKTDEIQLKLNRKFNYINEGDLILVKNGILNENKTKVLSTYDNFYILKIPKTFFICLNQLNNDEKKCVLSNCNPFDILHAKIKIVKSPNNYDWTYIERMRIHELKLIKHYEKKIFRMRIMIEKFNDFEGILKFYCSNCCKIFPCKGQIFCIKCNFQMKVIYDFSFVAKDEVSSALYFTFNVCSYNQQAESFFTGLKNPQFYYENFEKLQGCYKKEKQHLLTFLNFVWIIVEVYYDSSNGIQMRVIGDYSSNN